MGLRLVRLCFICGEEIVSEMWMVIVVKVYFGIVEEIIMIVNMVIFVIFYKGWEEMFKDMLMLIV